MSEIKNPEKQNVLISLIVAVLGIVIILVPFVIASLASYSFYFIYFGVLVILVAIGYSVFYYRRYRQFNAFLEKKDESLVWEYDEAKYRAFVGELSKLQRNADKKKVWILLGLELIIAILMTVTFSGSMRWLGVLFFVFFGGTSLLFLLVFPQSFKARALLKPYVTIINEDSAYIMGRFHKWSKAQAKIKKYNNGDDVYKVLAINYESLTRNGKLFQEWSAVIPEPDDKDVIAESKKWISRINKLSRIREKEKAEKKSYSEQFYDRMMGKNKKKKEEKVPDTKTLK
ncbi:hypothetical protein GH810_01930 [Acetobacterium paludosum]|uniref:Uncharacterized protein n=1 Tax=Acetobacterium paludosum TaxID=52693 RepID=A0A923KNF7_9FIRM|nr:hypothetical protein [Acetobacterium paludosum]MBC3887074.1 hypothetical protein [Acetobacterium paludosum]